MSSSTDIDTTANPYESRWRLHEGDEIVPGRTAIKLLGGGLRYEAYLAWDDELHSLVVVKVVRPGLCEDARTLEGLAEEVAMLARLHHPVLVRSFAADLDGPRPHVVLEHLEGPRLSTLVRKYGPVAPEQLLPLGLQLLAAAHYMERQDVVHLDIKPSNIIMGAPARLIDLSVALTVADCRGLRSAVGTDSYMAPEQCLAPDGPTVGPAADIWGIGVTLYRALTGERPFPKGEPGAEDPAARWPQLASPPVPLSARVSDALASPIMRCLAPAPEDRPRAAELAGELEEALGALRGPKISGLRPRAGWGS